MKRRCEGALIGALVVTVLVGGRWPAEAQEAPESVGPSASSEEAEAPAGGPSSVLGDPGTEADDTDQLLRQEAEGFNPQDLPTADYESFQGPIANDGTRWEAYYVGNVRWDHVFNGQPIKLQADLLVIYADLEDRIDFDEVSAKFDENRSDGQAEGEGEPNPNDTAVTIAGVRFRKFRFYSRGRVRADLLEQKSHIEADSLYYEHPTGIGVVRGVRLMTTVQRIAEADSLLSQRIETSATRRSFNSSNEFSQSPLILRADTLRLFGFYYFQGQGVQISNSGYGVPPVALGAKTAEVYAVDMTDKERARLRKLTAQESAETADQIYVPPSQRDTVAAEEDGDVSGSYIIDPENTSVTLLSHPVAPLPVARWDTRWSNDYLPVRSVDFGSSSAFGSFAGADWNLNFFTRLLPGGDSKPIRELDKSSRMGFDTIYFEERGLGWGPNVEYGTRPTRWDPWQLQLDAWTYHGESRYFGIDDKGDEDRTTRLPIPEEDRHWGRTWHRQALPYVGLLDIEYSDLSDRAMLGEYFETIAKQEKRQESLFYLRRNARDNLAMTALYKYRINDFDNETERLPEIRGLMFQQPIFRTGLYTDLTSEFSNIRVRPDDTLGLDSRRFERYDIGNQWIYPLNIEPLHPYVNLRPFFRMRYSYYSGVANPNDSEDRGTLGAGVTASQEWKRIFYFGRESFMNRILGMQNLKHILVPQVTYENTFENNLDPGDTLQVDRVDQVDLNEAFILSLRNDFLSRRQLPGKPKEFQPILGERDVPLEDAKFQTSRFFTSDLAVIIYPQPERDNEGDQTSFLRFDNQANLRRVTLRFWSEFNPSRNFRMERTDYSTTISFIPKQLLLTVGDRYTRDRSNTVYLNGRCWIRKKWAFDAFWSRNTDFGQTEEWGGSISRVFHRFVLTTEFVEDFGEDRNKTVFVSVSPVEFFRAQRFNR